MEDAILGGDEEEERETNQMVEDEKSGIDVKVHNKKSEFAIKRIKEEEDECLKELPG